MLKITKIIAPIVPPKTDKRKLSIEDKARRKFNELKRENPQWGLKCEGQYVGIVIKDKNLVVIFDGLLHIIGKYPKTVKGIRQARRDCLTNSYKVMGNGLNGFGGHVFHFVKFD